MSLFPTQPILRQTAELVAAALARSLEDLPCQIAIEAVASIYGQPVHLITLTLPGGPTFTLSPHLIDNGCGGIQDDTLVMIRQAAGQAISYRPRPADRPGKYFTDIISLDDPETP